jgi:VanZ family protein
MEFDKWINFGVFATLSWLGIITFYQRPNNTLNRAIIFSFFIALFYGTILELAQSFVPERTFDYADMTANYGGSLFGYVLFRLFYNNLYR